MVVLAQYVVRDDCISANKKMRLLIHLGYIEILRNWAVFVVYTVFVSMLLEGLLELNIQSWQ